MPIRRVRGEDRPKRPRRRRADLPPASVPYGNQLLSLVPAPVLARLGPHFERVDLERKQLLFRAHEPLRAAYFPDSAVISLVATVESGETLEVGLVGRDGVIGAPTSSGETTMPCDAIVQMPGIAHRIPISALRAAMLDSEALQSVLARFAQVTLMRSMQMSVCNSFHSVEQRCIRWLLTANDLLGYDDLPLTHDLIATMLGVHRPSVTAVLRALHKGDLVDERRGSVLIRNRRALEEQSCECYRMMRVEQRRLLGY